MNEETDTSSTKKTFLRKSILRLLYLFYFLSVIFLVYYIFFYRPFYRSQKKTSVPSTTTFQIQPHIDPSIMRLVGSLETDKQSSFPNYPINKPEGTIRIGCFGDSFTYGSEVDEKNDFPSHLSRIMKEAGMDNVEVINFGSPWHGFHQAFILWSEIGRQMDLNYFLLGPSGFHPQRETSFNHTEWLSPYYLHSRFILLNGELKRLDVSGDTYFDRFKNYYGLPPKNRYLRFDRNTPVFLKCLIPMNKRLTNPFYYSRMTMEEEATYIQGELLKEIHRSQPDLKIILGHYYPHVLQMAKNLHDPGLLTFRMIRVYHFPYTAPEGHNGPLGNALVARQFYFGLTGSSEGRLHLLETRNLESYQSENPESPSFPLEDCIMISVQLGSVTLGHLFHERTLQKATDQLKKDSPQSLIAFKNESSSILDSIFYAFPHSFRDGEPIELRGSHSNGHPKNFPLGKIRMLSVNPTLGFCAADGLSSTTEGILFKGNSKIPLTKLMDDFCVLYIGAQRVANGRLTEEGIVFEGLGEKTYRFMASPGGFVNIEDIERFGPLFLHLRSKAGTEKQLPIAQWYIDRIRWTR